MDTAGDSKKPPLAALRAQLGRGQQRGSSALDALSTSSDPTFGRRVAAGGDYRMSAATPTPEPKSRRTGPSPAKAAAAPKRYAPSAPTKNLLVPGRNEDGLAVSVSEVLGRGLQGFEDADLPNTRPVSFAAQTHSRLFALHVMPGGRVVTGGRVDGTVDIRHPHTGEVERSLTGAHRDSVLAMVDTPAGIFTAGADGVIVKWGASDLTKEMSMVQGGLVTAMTYAPHLGHTGLFTAGDAAHVLQWNIETGDEVAELDGQLAPVNCLCCDESFIFAGCADGSICVWESIDRQLVGRVEDCHNGDVWCIVNSGDGRVVTGGADGVARVWSALGLLKIGKADYEIRGHLCEIRAVQYYEGLVFTSSTDAVVAVWDTRRGDGDAVPIELLYACIDPKSARGKRTALVGGTPNSEDMSKASTPEVILQRRFTCLALEGNELTAVGWDGWIVKWNVETRLPSSMEVTELPPLVGGVDAEREAFVKLSVHERHERLQRQDVRRAVSLYTELPINFIIEGLYLKVKGSWLSMEMVPFILFLTLFTVFVLGEYSVIKMYNMTKGVRGLVEEQSIGGFKTTYSYNDVYNQITYRDFMYGAFVPKMWEMKPDPSAWYQPVYFAGQNEMASAIRLRTQRAKPGSCTFSTERLTQAALTHLETEACFGELDGIEASGQARASFACEFPRRSNNCTHNATELTHLFGLESGMFEFSDEGGSVLDALNYYGSGGYSIDLPMTLGVDEAWHRIDAALRNGFVDDVATRLVVIEFFHYNAEMNVFVAHKFVAEIQPGGAWYTRVLHFPFGVFDAQSSVGRLVYEAFFFLFVLYWGAKYFVDAYRHYKLHGSVIGYLLDVWTLLELVNVTLFFAAFSLRWMWFVESAQLTGSHQRPFDVRQYPIELDNLRVNFLAQVYLNSINTVLTYLKLLKYVQLNDKLNILTRTLAISANNIFGVLWLFVYFVFAFSMCGYVLFGENVFDYRTIDASYNSLLRLLVGDYDYDALSFTARGAALIFFWSYTVLSLFVLLNFLIAVLGDAFSEAVESRLPIPLDDSIVRAAQVVARSFSVRFLRITIVLFFHRSSKTALTAEHASNLRTLRESMLSEDGRRRMDYDELENTFLSKAEFIERVPEMLKSGANLNFMGEVWEDLAFEYHFRLRDRFNRARHEQEALVDDVLSSELKHIKEAILSCEKNTREMSALEDHLRRCSRTLEASGPAGQEMLLTSVTRSVPAHGPSLVAPIRRKSRSQDPNALHPEALGNVASGSLDVVNPISPAVSDNERHPNQPENAERDASNTEESSAHDASPPSSR
jgi:WD40 repeat protein